MLPPCGRPHNYPARHCSLSGDGRGVEQRADWCLRQQMIPFQRWDSDAALFKRGRSESGCGGSATPRSIRLSTGSLCCREQAGRALLEIGSPWLQSRLLWVRRHRAAALLTSAACLGFMAANLVALVLLFDHRCICNAPLGVCRNYKMKPF